MRLRATRPLHILACAPAIAIVAIVTAPTVRARDPEPPRPYVIAVDAGHGGSPDNSHPETPFDSGAIGINGLLEKDVALDIARRLRDGLEQGDLVSVAMTRDDDRYVSIEDRAAAAQSAGASLFVSVHLNSWTDPSVGGSIVLFPGPASSRLAEVMADALGRGLQPLGVESKGTELRDNWWIHLTMPVVTVEGGYLTNPQEAALLATPTFRQALAGSIRAGLEAYDPTIAARRAEILAWNRGHPGASVVVGRHPAGRAGGGHPPVAPLLAGLLLVTGVVAVLVRRPLGALTAELLVACQGSWPAGGAPGRRVSRRRRRQARLRLLEERARQPARPHSVYDELWF